jgi:hypothetical protein
MDAERYQRFTNDVVAWAETEKDVLGVVALGSMAGTTHAADEWSDHDFWVITTDAAVDTIRNDRKWLPDAGHIAVFFEESPHGRTIIYSDGHLVEHAVFTRDEMHVARANAYRVLVDKADIEARMRAIVAATSAAAHETPSDVVLGRFLTQLTIGLNRYGRGEAASAASLIRGAAPASLLTLIRRVTDPVPDAVLDNLDPHRRFEAAFPEIGTRIAEATANSIPSAASELLDIAEDVLAGARMSNAIAGIAAVRRVIDAAASARPGDT